MAPSVTNWIIPGTLSTITAILYSNPVAFINPELELYESLFVPSFTVISIVPNSPVFSSTILPTSFLEDYISCPGVKVASISLISIANPSV